MTQEKEAADHGKVLAQKIIAFAKNLDNLRDFVSVVGAVLEKSRVEDFEKNPDSLSAHILAVYELNPDAEPLPEEVLQKMRAQCDGKYEIEVTEVDGQRRAKVTGKGDNAERLRAASEVLMKAIKRRASLYNTSLMALVSEGEWFCAQLLHYYFAKHPAAAGLKEKNFSYEELVKFSSIEDAKKFLIDNRVEDILRGSFSDWIEFFKERIKISIAAFAIDLPYAHEASLRRNLLVHNGGVVNQLYLNKLPAEIPDRPKLDSQVDVSDEYFSDRTDRFEIIFLILALEVWGKLAKDDESRGVMATTMGFEALSKERYAVAEALCRYGMLDKSLTSDVRANAQVNYWQSFKWSGRFDQISKDVQAWDVRALDLPYQAAKYALLDDFENCKGIIRRALRAERITQEDLRIWPLFKDARRLGHFDEFLQDASSSSRPVEAVVEAALELPPKAGD